MTTPTAKLFDNWALSGRGDRMAEGHWPRVQNFFDAIDIKSGMTCVDIGCGNGYLVQKMAQLASPDGKAIGIDVSKEMVELATLRAKGEDIANNTEFFVAAADKLPFADSSVDHIVSIEMLYYAESPETALKEWHRITKAGGSLWVMVDYYKENQYSSSWGELLEVPVHFYGEEEYKVLFESAGFKSVETKRLFDPRPVDHVNFTAGWGYNTVQDVEDFRKNVGSLLIKGQK